MFRKGPHEYRFWSEASALSTPDMLKIQWVAKKNSVLKSRILPIYVVNSLSGWSMLAGVLASAGAFLSFFLVAYAILGNDCTGFFSCDLSRPDLVLGWYFFLLPGAAFVGSIISNSRARLGAVILIAAGTSAVPATIVIFLPFFESVDAGLSFSIYALAYISWEVLLFYAGYLSLRGRKSRSQDRRIWDPDLEPLETNFST